MLFPYDRNHQTFVNVYEGDRLTTQAIVDQDHPQLHYLVGTGAGGSRWCGGSWPPASTTS